MTNSLGGPAAGTQTNLSQSPYFTMNKYTPEPTCDIEKPTQTLGDYLDTLHKIIDEASHAAERLRNRLDPVSIRDPATSSPTPPAYTKNPNQSSPYNESLQSACSQLLDLVSSINNTSYQLDL